MPEEANKVVLDLQLSDVGYEPDRPICPEIICMTQSVPPRLGKN